VNWCIKIRQENIKIIFLIFHVIALYYIAYITVLTNKSLKLPLKYFYKNGFQRERYLTATYTPLISAAHNYTRLTPKTTEGTQQVTGTSTPVWWVTSYSTGHFMYYYKLRCDIYLSIYTFY
jgi:hypothetical protein